MWPALDRYADLHKADIMLCQNFFGEIPGLQRRRANCRVKEDSMRGLQLASVRNKQLLRLFAKMICLQDPMTISKTDSRVKWQLDSGFRDFGWQPNQYQYGQLCKFCTSSLKSIQVKLKPLMNDLLLKTIGRCRFEYLIAFPHHNHLCQCHFLHLRLSDLVFKTLSSQHNTHCTIQIGS